MFIERNGMKIELTESEIFAAHKAFIVSWMRSELETTFEIPELASDECAERAYGLYSAGNGDTEYECIEKAAKEYRNHKQKKNA